jgi:hypothetical protein
LIVPYPAISLSVQVNIPLTFSVPPKTVTPPPYRLSRVKDWIVVIAASNKTSPPWKSLLSLIRKEPRDLGDVGSHIDLVEALPARRGRALAN